MSRASKQFVADCTKGDAERDAGLTTPEDIVRFDDVAYGEDPKWNLLDVYRPVDLSLSNTDAGHDHADAGPVAESVSLFAPKGPGTQLPAPPADSEEEEVRLAESPADSEEEVTLTKSPADSEEENVTLASTGPASGDTKKLKKLPVIVNVHGGAWVYGDKEVYQFYCMSLAQRGFAVVNFNYRLAPDHKFPAQIEDVNEVFHWIFKNKKKYGFDTKNIFAVGDSAGAHLLGVYANILTNKDYSRYYSITVPKKLKLRGIALNCGKYDMDQKAEADPQLRTILKKDFLPGGATKKERELISVSRFVTPGFPPTVLMTCPGDFLMPQASLMVNAFEKNGVTFRYLFYGSKENTLWHVFHVNMRIPEAAKCNDEECAFFRLFAEMKPEEDEMKEEKKEKKEKKDKKSEEKEEKKLKKEKKPEEKEEKKAKKDKKAEKKEEKKAKKDKKAEKKEEKKSKKDRKSEEKKEKKAKKEKKEKRDQ